MHLHNPYVTALPEVSWFDFDRGVRAQILGHSQPPQTVAVEYVDTVKSVPMIDSLFRIQIRINGTDLLEITITRNAMPRYQAERDDVVYWYLIQ
jgi:hypothetical protein